MMRAKDPRVRRFVIKTYEFTCYSDPQIVSFFIILFIIIFCFVKSSKSFLSCLFLKPYRVYKVSQNVVTSINYAVPVCITEDMCMRAHWGFIPVKQGVMIIMSWLLRLGIKQPLLIWHSFAN